MPCITLLFSFLNLHFPTLTLHEMLLSISSFNFLRWFNPSLINSSRHRKDGNRVGTRPNSSDRHCSSVRAGALKSEGCFAQAKPSFTQHQSSCHGLAQSSLLKWKSALNIHSDRFIQKCLRLSWVYYYRCGWGPYNLAIMFYQLQCQLYLDDVWHLLTRVWGFFYGKAGAGSGRFAGELVFVVLRGC